MSFYIHTFFFQELFKKQKAAVKGSNVPQRGRPFSNTFTKNNERFYKVLKFDK